MALWLSRRCLWSRRIDAPLQNSISFWIRLLDPLRRYRETKAKQSFLKKTSQRKPVALFYMRKRRHWHFRFPQCDSGEHYSAGLFVYILLNGNKERNHYASLHHSGIKPAWHNEDNKKVAQLSFKRRKWASFPQKPQISKAMTITCHFQRRGPGFPQSTETERPFWWDRLNLLLLNVTAMIIWRMGGDG